MKTDRNSFGFLLIITALFCLDYNTAQALEITYSNKNPFDGSTSKVENILLKGEIVPGDYEYLLDVLANDTSRYFGARGFILASSGGDLNEALKISNFIKESFKLIAVSEYFGPCISACFFIYVSANERLSSSSYKALGVHRPYIHPKHYISFSAADARKYQNDLLKDSRVILENQSVPTDIIDKMFQRSSSEVYWLSSDEIENQIGMRSPWYEEYLIAKCQLNISMEKEYLSSGNLGLLDKLGSAYDCAETHTSTDRLKSLTIELFKYGKTIK